MDKDADYFAENTDEFEQLTDAQQEAVFNGENVEGGDTVDDEVKTDDDGVANPDDEGDTTTDTEVSGTPDAEPENDDLSETNEEDAGDEPTLLAKDGKNTIPYSELAQARAKAEQLEQLSEQQKTLIEQLQAAKIEDDKADSGTQAQDAVIDELQLEYPEIAEDLKPVIQKMIDEGIKKGVNEVAKQFDEKVEPIQQSVYETENQRRYEAIVKEHPDAVELYASKELDQWIKQQPSYIRDVYLGIKEQSTAQQMNEMLSAYKQATGKEASTARADVSSEASKARAKDIIASTEKKPPATLSDIPTGKAGTLDAEEAMLEMTPRQLEQKFEGKTAEEINELISRLV